jgi:hypothetical protein
VTQGMVPAVDLHYAAEEETGDESDSLPGTRKTGLCQDSVAAER